MQNRGSPPGPHSHALGLPPPSLSWQIGFQEPVTSSAVPDASQSCPGPRRDESPPGEEARGEPGGLPDPGPWALGSCSGACDPMSKAFIQPGGPFSTWRPSRPDGSAKGIHQAGLQPRGLKSCFLLSLGVGGRGYRVFNIQDRSPDA